MFYYFRVVALALLVSNPVVAQTKVIACSIGPRQPADCFIGKWKLDTEKSYVDSSYVPPWPKFHADLKLKRGSVTFRREGKDGYTFEVIAEFNDGTWQMAGPATFDSAYKGVWGDKKAVFTSKRVGDHGFKILMANEQTLTITEVLLFNVSSDDTTLVLTDFRPGEKNPFSTKRGHFF